MAQLTPIAWTEMSWNPVTGCTKVGPGCDHCYAEAFAERFRGVPGNAYEHGFDLTLRPERLEQPLHWRKPRLVFVNSMSDLFHEEIPTEYVDRVFNVMEQVPMHTFQVLTKRSSRLRNYVNARYADALAPRHIWLGVSVENRQALSRVEHLRQANATVRFISAEPLLSSLGTIDLTGIHWVIVGGESGHHFRPLNLDWAREVRDQCVAAGVPFFFKQVGGRTSKAGGNRLDRRVWEQFPAGHRQRS